MSQICKFVKTEVDRWLRELRKKWGVSSDRYEVVKIDMMIAYSVNILKIMNNLTKKEGSLKSTKVNHKLPNHLLEQNPLLFKEYNKIQQPTM